jgi:hypothetical protein
MEQRRKMWNNKPSLLVLVWVHWKMNVESLQQDIFVHMLFEDVNSNLSQLLYQTFWVGFIVLSSILFFHHLFSTNFSVCLFTHINLRRSLSSPPFSLPVLFLVFPLPRPPSRTLCEDFVEGCSSTGLSLPNCTEIDSTGLPVYPKGKATFIIAGVGTFMIPSEDYEEIDNLKKLRLDPVVCPYPLEYREGHTPTCQLTCPHSNIYTREEWEKVDPIRSGLLFYLILPLTHSFSLLGFTLSSLLCSSPASLYLRLYLSIISFVLDIWTLITLITIKERRVFPANLGIAACFIHAGG